MAALGKKIKYLRKIKGVTQDELAEILHISNQAISKWENGAAQPDISIIPMIANYFGVTIDELFGYKLNTMTNKERFVKFMYDNGVLTFENLTLSSGTHASYYINTENFTTNAQISKIGGFFADCIRENNIECDTIVGLAYHGIAFSTAASIALFEKYGVTVNYCYDRLVNDSRGRMICGHTLQNGEKVVLVDDLISSGQSLISRIDRLKELVDIQIVAVIVIVDRMERSNGLQSTGTEIIEKRYNTKVYSIVTQKDIATSIDNDIISSKNYLTEV